MKNTTDNDPHFPESKINIKNILINSFKFLIFEWKLFAIVLAFHIFKSFIFDQYSYTNKDPTLTLQYFEFVLMQIPQIIFELLFWVIIIPFIIFAVEDYLTKKQRISFKWKKMIIRYFVPLFTYKFLFSVFGFVAICISAISMFKKGSIPEPDIQIIGVFIGIFEMILGLMLFLAPVIIVLENKTFIDGIKKSVHIVRNNLKECVIFNMILNFINPFNILFVAILIKQGVLFDFYISYYLQLILGSGWFIIYNASIVGFYLSISERENSKTKNNRIEV